MQAAVYQPAGGALKILLDVTGPQDLYIPPSQPPKYIKAEPMEGSNISLKGRGVGGNSNPFRASELGTRSQ